MYAIWAGLAQEGTNFAENVTRDGIIIIVPSRSEFIGRMRLNRIYSVHLTSKIRRRAIRAFAIERLRGVSLLRRFSLSHRHTRPYAALAKTCVLPRFTVLSSELSTHVKA